MECERFKRLLKTWYVQVQSEALAPARMVDFMETHVMDCPVCLMDPDAKKDIAKIIKLVLPQEKLRQPAKHEPHEEFAEDEDVESLPGEAEEETDDDLDGEKDDVSEDEEDEELEDDEEK